MHAATCINLPATLFVPACCSSTGATGVDGALWRHLRLAHRVNQGSLPS